MSVAIYQNIIQRLSPELVDLIHQFVDPEITAIQEKVQNLIKRHRITPSGIFQTQFFDAGSRRIIRRPFEKSEYDWLLQKDILLDVCTLVKFMPVFAKHSSRQMEIVSFPFVRYIVGKTLEMNMTAEFRNIHTLFLSEPQVHLSLGQVILALMLCDFHFEKGINYVNPQYVPISFFLFTLSE